MALNKKKKRAIIIGGSIGGLFAGNILCKNGWEVDILEKAKVNLKAKKYNPATRQHEVFIEKKLPPHSK